MAWDEINLKCPRTPKAKDGNEVRLTERRSSLGGASWVERTHGGGLVQRGYQWNLNDHLGSSTPVLDGNRDTVKDPSIAKAPEERHSFDPWGARRNPANWAAASTPPVGSADGDGQSSADAGATQTVGRSSSQPSGYTGHQMLDDVGLIHMNGRLYDPFLGRFCAADPFVQSPNNIQNYNRYTYVLNNPLSLVDPSGHFFGIIFGFIASIIGAVVGAIVAVLGPILSAVIAAASKVIAFAVKFTTAVLSKSAAWVKAVGSKLVTAVR